MTIPEQLVPLLGGMNAALEVGLFCAAILVVARLTSHKTAVKVALFRSLFVGAVAAPCAVLFGGPHLGLFALQEPSPAGLSTPVAISSQTASMPVAFGQAHALLGLTFTSSLPRVLFLLWLAGACAVGLRYAWSLRRLTAICRRASLPRTQQLVTFRRLCRDMGIRYAELLLSEDVEAPCAFGWLRPVVILPVNGWASSHTRLHSALVHELNHIARRDTLWLAAAEIACALHWFNPLMWWNARQHRHEMELLCDGRVIDSGVPLASYLDAIAYAVRCAVSDRKLLPAATMASTGLSQRLQALVTSRYEAMPLRPFTQIAVYGCTSLFVLATASLGILSAVPASATSSITLTQMRPAFTVTPAASSSAPSVASSPEASIKAAAAAVASLPPQALADNAKTYVAAASERVEQPADDLLDESRHWLRSQGDESPLSPVMRKMHQSRLFLRVPAGVVVKIPEIGFGCDGMDCVTSAPAGTRLTLVANSYDPMALNWSGCSTDAARRACTIALPPGLSYVTVSR